MNVDRQVERNVHLVGAELECRVKALVAKFSTRTEASKVAGVSTDQLLRYERGSSPSFLPLARLCLAAGVRMEWLATGEGPERLDALQAAENNASQPVRLDQGRLIEALAITDRALALSRRRASTAARAKLVAMAYQVLLEEQQVSTALDRIMQAVEATQGATDD